MRKQSFFLLLAVIICTSASLAAQNLQGFKSSDLGYYGKNYESGTFVTYSYYVSPGAKADSCHLYVFLEGSKWYAETMDQLFLKKAIPEGLVICVNSGWLKPPFKAQDKLTRRMRAEEFDQYGPEFSNLLVEELIPVAAGKAGVTLSADPDKHIITGGSSGGMAAWNALWFRNDYFHCGFLASPTFSAMRGGEEPMVLVRKTEPRPIRAFITTGTKEPDYFFGDSFYAACNAADALEFAGYDVKFEVFAQGGHGYANITQEVCERAFQWLTSPQKVTVPRRSPRFVTVIPEGSEWTESEVTEVPPHKRVEKGGKVCSIKSGHLKFKGVKPEKEFSTQLENVTAIALSSDLWRLYATDADRRFIYAYTLDSLGVPVSQYKLAPLHLAHDCHTIGGMDMCVSDDDRVFVATELGIQSCCPFGLTDIILPLPGDVAAVNVWLKDNVLFARSADGKIYKRPVNATAHDGKTLCPPSGQGYGDGSGYSRPHFRTLFERHRKGSVL